MVYKSIWEDAIFTVTGMTSLRYNIVTDGGNTLIYSGRAYAKPNSNDVEINVARIVQDYLNCRLEEVDLASQTNEHALLNCSIVDEKGNELEEYKFLYCWDYETKFEDVWDVSPYRLSKPINNHSASGMIILTTNYNGTSVHTGANYVLNPSYCGDGALYYLNAKGGWDSFLIEGTVKKTESYERYDIQSNYRVDTLQFGHRNITHTSKLGWTLNTHLLTDAESKIFAANVIGSVSVYYHDLKANKIYPVTIDDNSVEFKQFKTNGRKFAQYSFKITSAQDRQRR